MIQKLFIALAVATFALGAGANTDKPFQPSQEALSEHLSMHSNAMACEAIGQASMIIAMFAHEMGLAAPEHVSTVITSLKGYMSKNPPKATDMGAYSRPRLPLIPDEACHPFHAKAATDSTAKLPPWQAA